MTDPQLIRRIARTEELLLAAHSALSALIDEENLLLEVAIPTVDGARSVEPEIRTAITAVHRVLLVARRRLRKLGAMESK